MIHGRSTVMFGRPIALRWISTVFGIATVILFAVSACTTAAGVSAGTDAPTLSWPGDPATTMAISWFDASDVDGVEMRIPAGDELNVATREGPVSRVVLTDLQPETTYDYRAVIAGVPESGWRTFTTAPEAGAQSSGQPDFLFAVVGDLQPFNAETVRTTELGISRVASLDPTFILQIGDVAEVGISRRSWRTAASVLATAGGEVPFVVTAGNHDYYYGLPSARNFKSFFPSPYADQTSPKRNTWYSQTVGPVHIAVLDTEAGGDDFDAQMAWLDDDLASAARAGIEWIFISMHRPVLASATGSEDQRWARALFPVIAEYDVDAVFWGHDHMYEHYEYQYGANGYVFDLSHAAAAEPAHLFTVGSIGARVDSLYPGFFTHRPFSEEWEMYNLATGQADPRVFTQRPWIRDNVKRESPGIRYQDPEVYPDAASYFSYPFDNAQDAAARRYSSDPAQRYSDDAEFFGYTYGETSIHYLWVEVSGDECVITAHYLDGPDGEHGPVMTTPDGAPQRWVLN